MTQDKVITALVSFAIGALLGALLGLLFAPMSGKELQYRVRKESELSAQKIRAEYQKSLSGIQRRMDGLKAQLAEMRR